MGIHRLEKAQGDRRVEQNVNFLKTSGGSYASTIWRKLNVCRKEGDDMTNIMKRDRAPSLV
ncbi:hypothetical protein Ancab_002312, partial [Ancistrocladus abbreviatus]